MRTPKEHIHEKERMQSLESYSILDTLSELDYDNITAIASQICETKISLVTLIDNNRQWFKSHHGLDVTETPRDLAFCAHAIHDENNVFMVEDARKDKRFHDNPLVTEDPHVIFYAGIPLISDQGYPLGTLCVIDNEPKVLNQSQIQSLKALANQVMNLLNLRKTKLALEKTKVSLEEKNEQLERFAGIAAHDLKSPLIGIKGLTEYLIKDNSHQIDASGNKMLSSILKSSNHLIRLISDLLDYSISDSVIKELKTEINLDELVQSLSNLFKIEKDVTINLDTSLTVISANRSALDQILINLLTNAIKYNDKDKRVINITVTNFDKYYQFEIKDNGPGIPLKYQKTVFHLFNTGNSQERRRGNSGNGIGLATVQKLVDKCGGMVKIDSAETNGAKFIFTIEK